VEEKSEQSSVNGDEIEMFSSSVHSEPELFSLTLKSTNVGTPMYRPPEFL
jgi:hypothetical protein